MKRQTVRHENIHVSVSRGPEITKVSVGDAYFAEDYKYRFWIPTSSLNEFQMVPKEILKARLGHDFGVEFDHYSYTTEV